MPVRLAGAAAPRRPASRWPARAVLDGVPVAEIDLDRAEADCRRRPRRRRAARPTAVARAIRPRTTPRAVVLARQVQRDPVQDLPVRAPPAPAAAGELRDREAGRLAARRRSRRLPPCASVVSASGDAAGLADARRLVAVAVGQPGARAVGDDEAARARRARDVEAARVADQLRALEVTAAPRPPPRPTPMCALPTNRSLAARRRDGHVGRQLVARRDARPAAARAPRTSGANRRLPAGKFSAGASERSA